jgi:hypothetical protein
MGLFTKKKNLAVEKLLQVGIDLNSIKHENYSTEELTFDDELAGKIKSSTSSSVSFWKFDTILLTDYKDGKRVILLAKSSSEERDIRDIVNELCNLFGNDWLFRNELQLHEIQSYRDSDEDFVTFRYWKDFDDFTAEINGHPNTSQISFALRGK